MKYKITQQKKKKKITESAQETKNKILINTSLQEKQRENKHCTTRQ
jgi:hypothetical protein